MQPGAPSPLTFGRISNGFDSMAAQENEDARPATSSAYARAEFTGRLPKPESGRRSLHRVGTPVAEGQTRSIDQIPNGACRQDLPGAGKCHDAGGKMQGDPREAVTPHLAFAGMNASANREAQRAGAYDELLLSIAPHGLARRTTPEHRRRSDVPRAVAMKLTGHETDAVYSRYHIARGKDLRAGVARVADYIEALHDSVQESGKETATAIRVPKVSSRK